MDKKTERFGTCIMVVDVGNLACGDSVDEYHCDIVCFCKEQSNIVLEKLIQQYRISEYRGIVLNEKSEMSSLVILDVDMNNYKGMQLTGNINDFIDIDSNLLRCKNDSLNMDKLKEAIDDISIGYIYYDKEHVDDVRNDLTEIYDKIKFKNQFVGCSVIVGYGKHTRKSINITEGLK